VANITTPDTIAPTTAPVTAVPSVDNSAPAVSGPIRWAEFSDGRVYLRGQVPSQAIADQIRAKAAAVVGDPNVVVEYQIVPGAPLPNSAPLYVRDSILFPAGLSSLNAQSRSILDLGVLLFKQNPQMSVVVSGFTDSSGTVADNLKLSRQRVDAIVRYFLGRGVSKTAVSGIAMGEAQAVGDNSTPEGRAKNRRVELEVTNLLG
jgi:outer membrane protein OmpA-like peptidoglycan-associated protein